MNVFCSPFMTCGAAQVRILKCSCIMQISWLDIWRKDKETGLKMRFYDVLQMDPGVLKQKIAACSTKQDKLYYWGAMAVRPF